jgi:hypothetical protein
MAYKERRTAYQAHTWRFSGTGGEGLEGGYGDEIHGEE